MRRDGFIAHIYAGAEEGFTLQKAREQTGGGADSLLEVDIKRGENHDMLRDQGAYSGLIRAALEGKIKAVVAAPNCRTRSILRHIPIQRDPSAPRPIRRWKGEEFGIDDITPQEQEMLRMDDKLMWRASFVFMVAFYMGEARALPSVLFSLEQPASPRAHKPEVVSWWDTKEWFQLKKEFGFQDRTAQAIKGWSVGICVL